MTRQLKVLIAALAASSALAAGPSAFANDGMCRGANDAKVPDKSTMCRNRLLWVCDMGEWKLAGGSC